MIDSGSLERFRAAQREWNDATLKRAFESMFPDYVQDEPELPLGAPPPPPFPAPLGASRE